MAYTKEQIQALFQSQFNISTWTDFIINFFKVDTFNVVPEPLDINPEEGVGYYWGDLSTKDDTLISFFYFKMNKNIDKRKVGLANLIKKYIKGIADVGIGVFDDGNHWRLSFITDMRGEKTSPKRFTFVFGDPENHYLTPVTRFVELQRKGISYANIRDAFSVEALTKQFYNDLFDWYTWALDPTSGVYFPNNPNTPEDDRDKLDTKMIRLITRLMFVWFIKQKKDANGNGLVPEGLFDPEELKLYLKDFDPQSMTSSNYYQAILQNLFFATLNRPIKTVTYDKDGNEHVERRCFATNKDKPDVKSKYRYQELFKINEDEILRLFEFIPFINGGLFECLDKNKTSDGVEHAYFHDGFSRNDTIDKVSGHYTKRAFIPNKLFFAEDGIISIFRRYNFTVEENSPSEQLVALDPELLGKVFENLLGAYNPETHDQVSDRKSSGSFYTPREVVNYMVDISLQAYLGDTDEVKTLFADDFEYDETKKLFYEDVINKLKAIKVLDPACGSGAFPMGMLNRIVEILQNLHAEGSKYDLKLAIMENCIFGGDIQTIAAQITKLRFFISLVCDCEKNDNPDDNFGIPNLPNLETHFVTCNSLISLKKPQQYSLFEQDVIALKEKLRDVRHEHFTAKTTYQKTKLRNRDKELRDELAEMLKSDNVIASEDAKQMVLWNPYDQNGKSSFFDPEWMFGIKRGFDIVIGNPPYIKEYTNRNAFDGFRESSPYYIGKMDLWYGFACIGLDYAVKEGGVLCFIAQNNWTTSAGAKLLRKKVVEDCRILKMIDFNDYMIFGESASVQTMIMLFSNDKMSDNYTIDYRHLKANAIKSDMIKLLMKVPTEKTDYLSPTFNRLFYKNSFITFSQADSILERMSREKTYLKENEIAQGIVFPQDFLNKKGQKILGKHRVGDGIFGLSCEELKNLNLDKNEMSLIKPYYTTEQIGRYYVKEGSNSLWMIYTDSTFKHASKMKCYPTLKKHLDAFLPILTSDNKPYGLHRARNNEFFIGEKIISLRKCVDRPSFTYSNFACYVTQTFFVIKSIRWNLKFLTGLLNSKLIAFWLKNKGKMQGENYQIDKEPLMNIPLPLIPLEKQREVIDKVDNILSKLSCDPLSNISEDENQIDILVYKLYGLKFEDARIIDSSLSKDEYDK